MAKRKHSDWLSAFIKHAETGEAPREVYFWVGVSCIAACLRRRVWLPMGHFEWIPNFYIIIVAPPGIISKTTSINIGTELVRQVPGIKFGPSAVTWQSLVTILAEAQEMYDDGKEMINMSPLTLESGEFGTLVDPHNREMIDMLVHMWDGKKEVFWKSTKTSGDDKVVNPFLNIIAATTPDWIGDNVPESLVGGGFTSRCIFVYADEKAKLVAYPGMITPAGYDDRKVDLIHDLELISQLVGPYVLEPDARQWGEDWYERHNTTRHLHLDSRRFGGYLARKQSHIHKLAMVLSASQRDNLHITVNDLERAEKAVTKLEETLPQIYSHIGTSEVAKGQAELVRIVRAYGVIDDTSLYARLFRTMGHDAYVTAKESAIKAGLIFTKIVNNEYLIYAVKPPSNAQ